MGSAIDVATRAIMRIADDANEFEFYDWCRCTCGHVRAAARGEENVPADKQSVWMPSFAAEPDYSAAIVAIARALGYAGGDPSGSAHFVSQRTRSTARQLSPAGVVVGTVATRREHAVEVLGEAIRALQAEDARAPEPVTVGVSS